MPKVLVAVLLFVSIACLFAWHFLAGVLFGLAAAAVAARANR